ncbi:D-amino acid aminotransferase [Glaciimonas sp. Gout2]|uniref:D-amino acid aminotransferase n=1 Tax=unclassified Glaciimonas TaxID=2644401 RepID=UPI002B232B63|nr:MULTISPECIES: D-amino acid aminotransferase [unclassified Glaciimonas]MEB0010808.1 D-amino acid aminotransferase [Glaciimonas sp. Cout2]MEB0082056.1 D-amino acid aminotransferase [Glaciimonas sp. Gout2]
MQDSIVYLNGVMTPLSDARIPVLDRGFIFGDGVYEVIPMYSGKAFRAKHHMARLFRSLAAIDIPNPHKVEEWMALINQVVAPYGQDDQMVYIHVTRGVAKRAHAFPKDVITPTVFIMTNPLVLPSDAVRAKGVSCITMEDQRWLHCEIKSISLLGNVLAAQNAAEHGVMEAIQFRDGFLTEASSSNVWIVKNNVLMAPPKNNLILEGIRYGLIEELCAAHDLQFVARQISRAEVVEADEVLLSSATKEILPVTVIDGKTIGNGQPGPIYKALYQAYQGAKAALCD